WCAGGHEVSKQYTAALASPAVSRIPASEIPGGVPGAPPAPRLGDGRADPRDGRGQPPVGRGAPPRRAPEARQPPRQVNDPALPARGPPTGSRRAGLGHLPTEPRG